MLGFKGLTDRNAQYLLYNTYWWKDQQKDDKSLFTTQQTGH